MNERGDLSAKAIFLFWLPLATNWLLMAVEGPFLTAFIARLPEPKYNLAAYGVAFVIGLILEAPIIMMLTAATALVRERHTYLKLRAFAFGMNALVTLATLTVLIPPVFDLLARDFMSLDKEVADLTYGALALLIPWPAAIGFRRFYQGVLIRGGKTGRVALGTLMRVGGMTVTCILLYFYSKLPGALIGAASLSIGVTFEALAIRWMATSTIHRTLANRTVTKELRYRAIGKFYYPLALTSLATLSVQPVVTFLVTQGRMPLQSLAVLPVIHSIVFIFRCLGMSYQEVAIALIGEGGQHHRSLRNFAIGLAGFTATALGVMAFTPLSMLWFERVAGLDRDLALFAVIPLQLMALQPALSLLISWQRALLVVTGRTRPITTATIIEFGGIILVMALIITKTDLNGAIAASGAMAVGRLLSCGYLALPKLAVTKDELVALPS